MKKNITQIMTGSVVVATMLFTGCGNTANTVDAGMNQPTDTTKVIRVSIAPDTDWTWFVGTDATSSASLFTLDTYFSQGIPSEVKHFQYFLDTDNKASTGFSFGQDSWKISGADYLLEDGNLYKSNSTTEWSWSYVGSFDGFEKSVEGDTAHIHTQTGAFASIVTADTINVTLEPFDANWGSTYSTISTQVIKLEKNAEDVTLEERIKAVLNLSVGALHSVTLTPHQQGAIVEYATDQGSYLELWGVEDAQNPRSEYLIEMDDTGHKDFKNIKMLGDGKVQYTTLRYGRDAFSEYTIVYDYFNKTEISATKVLDTVKKSIEDARNTKWSAQEVAIGRGYHVTKIEKIDAGLHLYLLHTTLETGGDGHAYVEVYDTQAMEVITTLQNVNMDGGPGTGEASNIVIHQDSHTITYDRKFNSWENQEFQDNLQRVGHYTYNYLTNEEIKTIEIIAQ